MTALMSRELIEYSLRGMIHRKTRSILTIASILIGITAIFILISFGIGLYGYVDQFSSASSANKITIMPKGFGGMSFQENPFFSEADFRAVQNAPGVYSAITINYAAAEIQQDKTKKYSFVIAYDPAKPRILMDLTGIKLFKGRQLNPSDSGKIVLGYNYLIKDKIMPKAYDVNSKIMVQGQELRVIGFFAPIGNPQDDAQMYVSQEMFRQLYPNKSAGYDWIYAEVDQSKIKQVVADVEKALRNSRNVKEGREDFTVQSFDDLLATYSNVLNGIAGFVILIALISVIVSAINTSNTMITSVLERTREIGVMKSVGATNSEILKIFLFESGVLGFIAGVLGVFFGWLIASSLGRIIVTAGWGFLSPAFPWTLFAGCILFATATGAISGLLPAIKASKTNPVQALRYE
jgi:putative ABC transport system permease protein